MKLVIEYLCPMCAAWITGKRRFGQHFIDKHNVLGREVKNIGKDK